jgi:hypothetical protein
MEVVEFTGTVTLADGSSTQSGMTDDDTFDSKLVRPTQVFVQLDVENADNSITTVSGKTITFVNTGQSNVTVRFIVFGY